MASTKEMIMNKRVPIKYLSFENCCTKTNHAMQQCTIAIFDYRNTRKLLNFSIYNHQYCIHYGKDSRSMFHFLPSLRDNWDIL